MKIKPWPNGVASTLKLKIKLGYNCHSVWPGLACTYVDLRWFKLARKSTQVFHCFATQPKLQVEWRPLNLLLTDDNHDITGYVCLQMGFLANCVYLWENLPVYLATQRKSLRKLNLLLLSTICDSVWPGLKTLLSNFQWLTWFEYL